MTWALKALALGLGGAVVLLVLMALAGALFLPPGHKATVSARFRQAPEAIWAAITDHAAMPAWRPGVERMERLPDRNGHEVWREHGPHGAMTIETVEAIAPRRLVGRIVDEARFGGTWTFEIAGADGGSTLTITEDGEIYNPLFRFLARFFFRHEATLEAYLAGLRRKFGAA